MTIFATAGAKLFIGGVIDVTDDLAEANFASQTWVEIKRTEGLGSLGDSAEPVPFDEIAKARRTKLKGIRDAGTMEVVCGIDYADPGQQAVLAAEKEPHDYAFKLVFNDAPEGGTASERKFGAIVGSASEALDVANSVMKLNMSLWINSNVVRLDAAPA